MSEKKFDHFYGKEVTEKEYEKLVEGIVSFKEDGTPVIGRFTPTHNVVGVVIDGNIKNALNKEILEKNFVKGADNIYVSIYELPFSKWFSKLQISQPLKTSFDYSVTKETIERRSSYLEKADFKISNAAMNLARNLKKLSVGMEFETSLGLIDKKSQLMSGLVPLRDGSIAGLEYVTIPLSGEKGAQVLINAINVLSENTRVNNDCALHYHFGGIPRTESFIVALWRIINAIQNDLYLLQPPYKSLNWGIKRKNYSAPLSPSVISKMKFGKDELKRSMSSIIEYLTDGQVTYGDYDNSLNNIKNHPADPENRQKWNITKRYSIVNFIPLIFGNKQTVEFRLSEVTTNATAIVEEISLFARIINYTMENEDQIVNDVDFLNRFSLHQLLTSSSVDTSYLRNYMQERQRVIEACVKDNTFKYLHEHRFKTANALYFVEGVISKEVEASYFKSFKGVERDEYAIRKQGVTYESLSMNSILNGMSGNIPLNNTISLFNGVVMRTNLGTFLNNAVSINYQDLLSSSSRTWTSDMIIEFLNMVGLHKYSLNNDYVTHFSNFLTAGPEWGDRFAKFLGLVLNQQDVREDLFKTKLNDLIARVSSKYSEFFQTPVVMTLTNTENNRQAYFKMTRVVDGREINFGSIIMNMCSSMILDLWLMCFVKTLAIDNSIPVDRVIRNNSMVNNSNILSKFLTLQAAIRSVSNSMSRETPPVLRTVEYDHLEHTHVATISKRFFRESIEEMLVSTDFV